MNISLLFAHLFFSPALSFAADTTQLVFDGYYQITLGGKHVGYTVQKQEFDPKKKQFHVSYFTKTNKLGGDIQESVKAIANDKFEPISYSYTSQSGDKVKTIDGSFKGEVMKLTSIDGKVKKDETFKNPKGTFLSSYLGFLMLQKGISAGTKFSYSAVAEEDGNSYNGEALIKEKTEQEGQQGFRILNKFKGQNFVSFMNDKGEVLGTESEDGKLVSKLVKDPSIATQGFTIPAPVFKLIFGGTPTGKTNSLQKKGP